MAILKFLFLFVLLAVFAVVFFGAAFILRIVRMLRRAIGQTTRGGDGAQARRGRRPLGTYGNEERVIDNRNPEQANRKIFSDEEGEYVDFVEEK